MFETPTCHLKNWGIGISNFCLLGYPVFSMVLRHALGPLPSRNAAKKQVQDLTDALQRQYAPRSLAELRNVTTWKPRK